MTRQVLINKYTLIAICESKKIAYSCNAKKLIVKKEKFVVG